MENLKNILAQEDTVLFIGSGISLWAGLPTWSSMIEELAQFVERTGTKADLIRSEANRGELLQAASYGFDKLTKQQIGEFIRAACRYGAAKPHDIHKKIVSLGPRCFVTTNYDDLIEQSLRKWQPDRFYKPPVTNRHLTETAEIVHARAIDFIFKPHGDAGDSDSIVLTREQYRQLLPQGERQAALESVKMLLASRPVVYFGFGLRDPDFIYVRDLLANTYKGGTRDHYAVMADVTETEKDYWRRNYGIHLISYTTAESQDNSKDHSELLVLLDSLLEEVPSAVPIPAFDPTSPEVLLALARHASALTRTPKFAPELSIRVRSEKKQANGFWHRLDKFDYSQVETFLDSGPERTILIGLPGAGKTYSLRQAAARMAEELNKTCLAETFEHSAVSVPIIADLKLYRGNLSELVSKTLPNCLPLWELVKEFKVKIFLDSFNEMPREFWESGAYESDFQSFIKSIGHTSIIISSRTSDGLGKLGFPAYCLDLIDEEVVAKELQRLGLTFEGRFSNETLQLLQRPFYFHYVASGEITLPEESHPRDFYRKFFENTNSAFASRFDKSLDFENILSIVAYEALNNGEEAFSISELLGALKLGLMSSGITDLSPRDVANWLVSRSVLLPYSGSRIALIHQSVTEYLAATELSRRYLIDRHILKGKLALTRWDQALFLTLSLLPQKYAELFLHDVIKTDLVLALEAVKYLETDRDEIVSALLSEIPKLARSDSATSWKIESVIKNRLPLSERHEHELRTIIDCGGTLGGAGVIKLIDLKGEVIKDEMLKYLFEKSKDFNFCVSGVARGLGKYASQDDISTIVAWAEILQSEKLSDPDTDSHGGFVGGAAVFLSTLDLGLIRSEIFSKYNSKQIPDIICEILCEIIRRHSSTEALNFAAELLNKGVKNAAVAIYFIARFNENFEALSWSAYSSQHVDFLTGIIGVDDKYWALKALEMLCKGRKDLANLLEQYASQKSGVRKAVLLNCIYPENKMLIFDALVELATLNNLELESEPLGLLYNKEIDWSAKSELLISLLKKRNISIADALLGNSIPVFRNGLENLEIEDYEWWLDWMFEIEQSNPDSRMLWF